MSASDAPNADVRIDNRNNEKLSNAHTSKRLPLLLPSPTPSGQQDSLTPVASAHAPVTAGYYGTLIGRLETHHHEASGEVYAIDESSIFVRGFSYDGTGPDAYFWAGSSVRPDASGFIIPDEKGS